MSQKEWVYKEFDEDDVIRLAYHLRIPQAIASVYLARGITTVEQAKDFCNLGMEKLHNPFELPDIKPVLKRLNRAINEKKKIFVYGDYDVDGITSTAVVVTTLKMLGANFDYHVPHRMNDGYDIKEDGVDRALAAGADLLMSVDCGILAFDAADYARENGLDMIITDHHEPEEDGSLPDCIGVINPNRHDSTYPFSGLAGVGIAFKVMVALWVSRGQDVCELLPHILDYAALGTVADVAPMIDENRSIVALGCQTLSQAFAPGFNKPGLAALLMAAEVKEITTTSIGFGVGPRINAIGRIDDAALALALMLERDPDRARAGAQRLETANKRRQDMQERMVKEAMALLPENIEDVPPIIVLGAKSWHPGIVGLVASKLAEAYSRPAVICGILDNGMAKGSVRSRRDFNIINALKSKECLPLYAKKKNGAPVCGGHAFAAGLSMPAENLPILQEKLSAYAMGRKISLDPTLEIDAVLQLNEVTDATFAAIEKMAPFGQMNEQPIFAIEGLRVSESKTLSDGKHLKLSLQDGFAPKRNLSALWWRNGAREAEFPVGQLIDVAFKLTRDEFRGRSELRLTVEDIRLSGTDLD